MEDTGVWEWGASAQLCALLNNEHKHKSAHKQNAFTVNCCLWFYQSANKTKNTTIPWHRMENRCLSNQRNVQFSHTRHLFAIIGEFDFCHQCNFPAMPGYLKAPVKLNTPRYNFHTQCIFLCQSQFTIAEWDFCHLCA